VFADPKLQFRTEERSYPNNVPTFVFENQSFGGADPPEGLKNAPDIPAENFPEISNLTAKGAGSAGKSKKIIEFLWRFKRAGEQSYISAT
jgi:hypothetical protein